MTHIHTNQTVQTENVANGKVILKGCISGQKQTRLSKKAQWWTFRQFRVSETVTGNVFLIIVPLALVWLSTRASRLLHKCHENITICVLKLVVAVV